MITRSELYVVTNDPVSSVKATYIAVHRESLRTCQVYDWQVANTDWIAEWNRDGWDVKTIISSYSILTAGEVIYRPGIEDLNARIRRLTNQLEEMRADRDTWKALANG